MVDHLMDVPSIDDGEQFTASESVGPAWSSPTSPLSHALYGEMSLSVLAAYCARELSTAGWTEPCTETYGVELLRRAIVHGDQEAWTWVQRCFGGVVLHWLRCHPQSAAACRLESEDHYVAQAFERFWQAATSNQRVECNTLAAVLHYLRASLNGTILDTLRASAWPRTISRPVPGDPGESPMEDMSSSSEVWEMLKTLLPNARERRLAYLLFHCGLGPREIVQCCPQEFDDVGEISGLRCTIMERVLRNADLLR